MYVHTFVCVCECASVKLCACVCVCGVANIFFCVERACAYHHMCGDALFLTRSFALSLSHSPAKHMGRTVAREAAALKITVAIESATQSPRSENTNV